MLKSNVVLLAGVGVVPVSVSLAYHVAASAVKLQLHNLNIPIAIEFEISDMAYNTAGLPKRVSLNPGQHVTIPVDVSNSGNWYDLQVTLVSDALSFQRRFMGRMETGADSISDPAMSAAVPARRGVEPTQHPLLPHHLTHLKIAAARLNKASVAEQAHLQKDAIVYPLKEEL
jgi:phospholipase C